MKKTKLLLLCSACFLLTGLAFGVSGCNKDNGSGSGGEGGGGGGTSELPDPETVPYNQTYYFHLDYSHSENNDAVAKIQWWRGYPLGEVPEKCKLTSENASDPLFPVFLGWSEYSSSLDDSLLWNFKTDFKQTQTVHLYGIWVAND